MWFDILKRIFPYKKDKEVDYTSESHETSFEWIDGIASCSFVVDENRLTIFLFNVGYENRGKKLGETILKKFIKEAEEKFNRKFKIIIEGPTEHGLPFWKRMKRKGLIDEWY